MLHFWTPLPSEELLEHLRAEAVRRYPGYELQLLFRETEAGVRYSFYFKPLAGYELRTAPGFPTYPMWRPLRHFWMGRGRTRLDGVFGLYSSQTRLANRFYRLWAAIRCKVLRRMDLWLLLLFLPVVALASGLYGPIFRLIDAPLMAAWSIPPLKAMMSAVIGYPPSPLGAFVELVVAPLWMYFNYALLFQDESLEGPFPVLRLCAVIIVAHLVMGFAVPALMGY